MVAVDGCSRRWRRSGRADVEVLGDNRAGVRRDQRP
jgi:hypothetical protein